MLIGRKVTKDKRTVPDFRHLNVKNSQKQSCISFTKIYILNVRKFKMWRTYCFRSKICISIIEALKNFTRFCEILPSFGSASFLYQRIPMVLNISQAIWLSCISSFLDCLQSRKYWEAIVCDLLLFTQMKKTWQN